MSTPVVVDGCLIEARDVQKSFGQTPGPKVIDADEPTGSLDALTGEKVMDLLQAAVLRIQGGHTKVAVRYSGRVHIVYPSFTFALGPPGRPLWATFPPACAWPQLQLPPSS